MPRRTLEERLNYVSLDDYRTAYILLVGEEEAERILADIHSDLTNNPENDIVLDPKFIALLALFTESGRELADALLTPDQVAAMQEDLAREHPRVATRFPHLLK